MHRCGKKLEVANLVNSMYYYIQCLNLLLQVFRAMVVEFSEVAKGNFTEEELTRAK